MQEPGVCGSGVRLGQQAEPLSLTRALLQGQGAPSPAPWPCQGTYRAFLSPCLHHSPLPVNLRGFAQTLCFHATPFDWESRLPKACQLSPCQQNHFCASNSICHYSSFKGQASAETGGLPGWLMRRAPARRKGLLTPAPRRDECCREAGCYAPKLFSSP